MSFDGQKDSPDKQDVRPSFRKPINDSANRKYRHRSPADRSDSSLSGGTPKNHGKELERDSGHNRSGKIIDSRKYFDRHSYRSSHDYNLGGGNENRDSIKHSKHDRGSKSAHFEAKYSDNIERSKEETQNADGAAHSHHARDKYEYSEHRNAGKNREMNSKAFIDGRQMISRNHKRVDDRDDRRMRHRSPIDYGEENASPREDCRGRVISGYRSKESRKNEIDQKNCRALKRRYQDKRSLNTDEYRESDKLPVYQARERKSDMHVDKSYHTSEEQISATKLKTPQSVPLNVTEGKPCFSSKQVKEATEKLTLEPTCSTDSHTKVAPDLNEAKVAAIKAAELVNRNLVGTGLMSTDQKKKLLWGNKKSSSEEAGSQAGNRWECQLFADRERQEKFNKLMGVKGDIIFQERLPDEKDVEKQKELQTDLEKQYTAGLRRRDGRTVGLGL